MTSQGPGPERRSSGYPKKFGIFMAPFWPDDESPTIQLERGIETIEHLDRLGFHEVWIGEHHSMSFELIADPAIYIAAAAQRTHQIKLGTGVLSASYHHPLIVADKMVLLDHLTRGRSMLGFGPGQLPTDAYMMGIDPNEQRRMMLESMEAVTRLLAGEVVDMETDWFKLREARLQLLPYSDPWMELAVASSVSPTGSLVGGRFDTGLISIAAASPEGFAALATNWEIYEEESRAHGHVPDRGRWRLCLPMHIAETKEQARKEAEWGVLKFGKYVESVLNQDLPFHGDAAAGVETWATVGLGALGSAVIGTPDEAIERIDQLVEQTGGFGTLLFFDHGGASPEATAKSYELFARYVMPRLRESNRPRQEALAWARERSAQNLKEITGAIDKAIADYGAEHPERELGGLQTPHDKDDSDDASDTPTDETSMESTTR